MVTLGKNLLLTYMCVYTQELGVTSRLGGIPPRMIGPVTFAVVSFDMFWGIVQLYKYYSRTSAARSLTRRYRPLIVAGTGPLLSLLPPVRVPLNLRLDRFITMRGANDDC